LKQGKRLTAETTINTVVENLKWLQGYEVQGTSEWKDLDCILQAAEASRDRLTSPESVSAALAYASSEKCLTMLDTKKRNPFYVNLLRLQGEAPLVIEKEYSQFLSTLKYLAAVHQHDTALKGHFGCLEAVSHRLKPTARNSDGDQAV